MVSATRDLVGYVIWKGKTYAVFLSINKYVYIKYISVGYWITDHLRICSFYIFCALILAKIEKIYKLVILYVRYNFQFEKDISSKMCWTYSLLVCHITHALL